MTAAAADGEAAEDAVRAATADEDAERGPAFVAARAQALLIVPVRLMLAIAGLVGALILGVPGSSALVLFVVAGGLVLLARLTGRRRRIFWIEVREATEVDVGAPIESPVRTTLRAMFPSTIGLTVLTAIALAVNARLAAFLCGALAGLAVAAALSGAEIALWERDHGRQILLHRNRVYVR